MQTGTSITSQSSSRPLKGSTVCRYGKDSGFGTSTIESNNTGWPIETATDAKMIYGMIYIKIVTGDNTEPGDSGGPVYIGNVFHGTISSTSNSSGFYFSPISGVPASFSVKTS